MDVVCSRFIPTERLVFGVGGVPTYRTRLPYRAYITDLYTLGTVHTYGNFVISGNTFLSTVRFENHRFETTKSNY